MKAALLAPLALLLAACSSESYGSRYEVCASPGFPQAELLEVYGAAAGWEAAVGDPAELRVEVLAGCECAELAAGVVCLRRATLAEIEQRASAANLGSAGEEVVGLTRRDPGDWSEVWVAADYPEAPQMIGRALRHELGHAFGLVHTGPGTIMALAVNDQPPDVTPADVWQYRDLRGGSR